MNIIKIAGTPYECGLRLGEYFKKQIENRLERNSINNKRIHDLKEKLDRAHTIHLAHYPQYVEELKGISEGAGQDYWKLLLLNCPHLIDLAHGCTSIACSCKKGVFLAHNEDGVNGDCKEECALVEFTYPDNHFFAFVYAGELPGCAYGWNKHHIYFSVNYIPPFEKADEHISRYFTARALLDAKTIEECLRILNAPTNAGGFHYFIGQNDNLYSIETAKGRCSESKVSDIAIHTNHYVHPPFSHILLGSENSKMRYAKAQSYLEKNKDICEILLDKEGDPLCIHSSNELNRTLSTVVFYPKEKQVIIYSGNTETDSRKLNL